MFNFFSDYYVKDKLKCWKCGNESFSTKKYQNHKNTCRQVGKHKFKTK